MSARPANKADGRSKRRPGVEEQRDTIMAAAVELFADSGTRPVSIAQICERADVSRPTFYRCYPDKEALVAAIYDNAVNAPVEDMLLQGRLSDTDSLEAGVGRMLDAIFEQAPLARLIFIEASDPTSPAAQIVDRAFERAAMALAGDLEKMGRPVPSRVYLKSIMAAVQWIAFDAIRKGLRARDVKEAKGAALAVILKGLG